MEIKRKWLFDKNKIPMGVSATIVDCGQAYLSIEPEVIIRRKRYIRNIFANNLIPEHETYKIYLKSNDTLSREEVEKEVSFDEFKSLMKIGNIKDKDFIKKHYCVIPLYGKYRLIVGIVDEGTTNEFCYGQIEFDSEEDSEAFIIPDWFGDEVTLNPTYKMKNYWKRTRLNK